MDRILHYDERSGEVRVQAGIRVDRLLTALSQWNRTLLTSGTHHIQSLGTTLLPLPHDTYFLAGAIQTATHGSKRTAPSLASLVSEVRLVLANATAITLNPSSYCFLSYCASCDAVSSFMVRPYFGASVVSLGGLGIVTEVTLRTVPISLCQRIDQPVSVHVYLCLLTHLSSYT